MHPSSTPRLSCFVALLFASGVAPAAQKILHTSHGTVDSSEHGVSVSGAGDVNGDGYDDYVVGSRYWGSTGEPKRGRARVMSGIDGTLIYEVFGTSTGDTLGWSVSDAGDVDGDGLADVIVGVPNERVLNTPSGSALVLSGSSGAILLSLSDQVQLDQFGRSVSGAGDLNNDGYDDVIVGAPEYDTPNDPLRVNVGRAYAFSGNTGSLLYTWEGDDPGDYFGTAVAGVGDVDGDGFDDVIVGADRNGKLQTQAGMARVFSGADGSVLYEFLGDGSYDRLGNAVSRAGDVNGDGTPDILVGAHKANNGFGVDPGMARVYSGTDGSILHTWYGDSQKDELGRSVGDAGDVDGDGYDDIIAGAAYEDVNGVTSGVARVFSGADGSLLYMLEGEALGDSLGWSSDGAGDVDGDGYADVIVGAHKVAHAGLNKAGMARVYAGGPPATMLQEWSTLTAGGQASLTLSNAAPLGQVYVAFSLTGLQDLFLPSINTTIAIHQPFILFTVPTDATGGLALSFPLPPGIAGLSLWLQTAASGAVSNWQYRLVQ